MAWSCTASKECPIDSNAPRSASSSVLPSTPRVSAVISASTSTGRAAVRCARSRSTRPSASSMITSACAAIRLCWNTGWMVRRCFLPQRALAGQQPVAERPLGLGVADALVVVGGVVGEHVLGVVGVVEDVERLRADRHPDRVAVLADRARSSGRAGPRAAARRSPQGRPTGGPGGTRRVARGGHAAAGRAVGSPSSVTAVASACFAARLGLGVLFGLELRPWPCRRSAGSRGTFRGSGRRWRWRRTGRRRCAATMNRP